VVGTPLRALRHRSHALPTMWCRTTRADSARPDRTVAGEAARLGYLMKSVAPSPGSDIHRPRIQAAPQLGAPRALRHASPWPDRSPGGIGSANLHRTAISLPGPPPHWVLPTTRPPTPRSLQPHKIPIDAPPAAVSLNRAITGMLPGSTPAIAHKLTNASGLGAQVGRLANLMCSCMRPYAGGRPLGSFEVR
jgi:hypothetical protein